MYRLQEGLDLSAYKEMTESARLTSLSPNKQGEQHESQQALENGEGNCGTGRRCELKVLFSIDGNKEPSG